MIDQHLLLTLSLCEHDGTPLQSRLSEREVACWISNRALRPEYRVRRGTCDLGTWQWHCARTRLCLRHKSLELRRLLKRIRQQACVLSLKVFITYYSALWF